MGKVNDDVFHKGMDAVRYFGGFRGVPRYFTPNERQKMVHSWHHSDANPYLTWWIEDSNNKLERTEATCRLKGEWIMRELRIKRVLHKNPATIVFWQDGSKTVVKCGEGETYDKEKGILWAFYKRHSGLSPKRAKAQMAKFVKKGE